MSKMGQTGMDDLNLYNNYFKPHNCLETITGIMPLDGTYVIMKKPMYWVWKARIEYTDRKTDQHECCSFHEAVEFVRARIKKQEAK